MKYQIVFLIKLMGQNQDKETLLRILQKLYFGVKTDKAEIAFFSVEPTNISVLSEANIDVKIHRLMMLLSTIPDLEVLARALTAILKNLEQNEMKSESIDKTVRFIEY